MPDNMYLNPIILWKNYKLNGALRGASSTPLFEGPRIKLTMAAMSDYISKTFGPFLIQSKLLFLKAYITHIIQYNF